VVTKQAEQVFSEFEQISRYQIIVGRRAQRDELVFKVELKDESIDKAKLADALAERFPQVCRVRPDRIEFVTAGTIPEERQTIVDTRTWK